MNEQIAAAAAALAANMTRSPSLPPALVFGRIVTALGTMATTTASSLLVLGSEAFWHGLNGSMNAASPLHGAVAIKNTQTLHGIIDGNGSISGGGGVIDNNGHIVIGNNETSSIVVNVNDIIGGGGSDGGIGGVSGNSPWSAFGRIQVPMYAVILLLAIVGNFLVIMTLVQHRRMRTITNVFLLNLAVSDILLGVLCMPITLVGALLRDFIFGATMCRVMPYLQGLYYFLCLLMKNTPNSLLNGVS